MNSSSVSPCHWHVLAASEFKTPFEIAVHPRKFYILISAAVKVLFLLKQHGQKVRGQKMHGHRMSLQPQISDPYVVWPVFHMAP